ncbi:IS1595 family transposase ISPlba4 [Aquella oligotrophica]|uniref:IS1595 family transposase ISPlba4 n=1 Tax=Aquella oligotrophica TaxID=2067065 RepID=A0A2I7N5K1_9NEIS|nr:IS1595 family transposase ISPlba4 [Aquella oligotrophica]AUR51744.1 IS1595 family transposase ISPlba4 [Aquella oligotrophica]
MEAISKNRYVRRAKISEYKFRKLVKYFAEDLSATQISMLTQINRNTVNRYLNEIRERIVEFCEQYSPIPEQEKDTTETKLQTLSEKVSNNLGLLKRRGKVYATLVANYTSEKVRTLLNMATKPDSKDLKVHSIDVNEEDGVIAIGYDDLPLYIDKPSYVENLDTFWSFTRERLGKFQGLAKHKFYLHLKECEFRFNFRNDNLYAVMLKLISSKPIS